MLPTPEGGGFSRPAGKPYRASAPTATGSALRDGPAQPEADAMGGVGVGDQANSTRPSTGLFLHKRVEPAIQRYFRGPVGPPGVPPHGYTEWPQPGYSLDFHQIKQHSTAGRRDGPATRKSLLALCYALHRSGGCRMRKRIHTQAYY
jgi:hypothetical protein